MSRLFWGATPVFSHGDRIALAAGSLTATEIDAITKQPGTDTFLPQLAPRLFLPSDIGHAATQKLSSEERSSPRSKSCPDFATKKIATHKQDHTTLQSRHCPVSGRFLSMLITLSRLSDLQCLLTRQIRTHERWPTQHAVINDRQKRIGASPFLEYTIRCVTIRAGHAAQYQVCRASATWLTVMCLL